MNKPSRAILALFLLLSAKAYSKDNLVSRELLKASDLDPVVLEQLLKEKILLPSRSPDFFILNGKKVEQVLATTQDQEVKEFLIWLKSISGDKTEINQKNPNDMTIASQDIKA